MNDILIMAIPNDYHTMAVQWGLEQLGSGALIWVPGDLPDYATASMEFSAGEMRLTIKSLGVDIRLDDVAVFWNRRLSSATIPATASRYDAQAIERESNEHIRNIRGLLGEKCICINNPISQFVADRKAVQIKHAIESGLEVPPTLFSNDYDRISAFHRMHAPVIAKPYQTYAWVTEEGETLAQMTSDMPSPSEFSRSALEHCPLIVQRKIRKSFEARLVVLDQLPVCAKMADIDSTELDSRVAIRSGAVNFSLIDAPAAVVASCLDYMSRTGLVFGAFDFIIDDDGLWYFLECNEMGQFLFIEQALPGSLLLDRFCRWLLKLSGVAARTLAAYPTLRLKDFDESARVAELRTVQTGHKPRREPPQVMHEDG